MKARRYNHRLTSDDATKMDSTKKSKSDWLEAKNKD